jgi:Tfp pilus assembly protein PilV
LLEVALAVALLAVSGLGLVSTQLTLSRHGQSAALRGQAAFIADALAQTAIEGSSGAGVGDQWKTRAAVLIPGAVVSVDGGGGATSSSTVSWPAASYGPTSADGEAPGSCVGSSAQSRRECVSLVFAR